MKIACLQFNPIQENTYVVWDDTKACIVIDAGNSNPREDAALDNFIAEHGLKPVMAVNTHGHFDHTSAVRPLLENHPDVPVYIHEKDSVDGPGGELRFSRVGEENQRYYKEGDVITVGTIPLRVMETPGHSEGSVCLLAEGEHVIFAGDTLFRCSCGRTDFPGGSTKKILASLARLGRLEGDLAVYPGHMEPSTLDRERRSNPYLLQALGGERP